MPKTNFNKVLTLWTCQTYMENMSTTLKPDEISFWVLFFWHKLRQFRTFLKLLPKYLPTLLRNCVKNFHVRFFPHVLKNWVLIPLVISGAQNNVDLNTFVISVPKNYSKIFVSWNHDDIADIIVKQLFCLQRKRNPFI